MSDDLWESLFAQAADVGSAIDVEEDTQGGPSTSRHTEKGRKRKKRRRAQSEDNYNAEYNKIVEDRIRLVDSADAWPHWFSLSGENLPHSSIDRGCIQKSSARDHANKQSTDCRDPVFVRRLEVPAGVDDIHRIFQSIRNLRCTAKILAERYIPTKLLSPALAKRMREELDEQSSAVARSKTLVFSRLPHEEAKILLTKIESVESYTQILRRRLKIDTKVKSRHKEESESLSTSDGKGVGICSHWDPAIRLIIACDDLYYRLYYLQLTKAIPIFRWNEKVCFFPHPSEYFGLMDLTMNSTAIKGHLKLQTDHPSTNHPLEFIYRIRQLETTALFTESGWITAHDTISATFRSLNQSRHGGDPQSKHNTPAPEVLSEWRDGCRDLLCNLYAYASVPSSVLSELVSFFKRHRSILGSSIVEIGAGTGYIAKLLQDRGMSIEPWDIRPPSSESPSMNEYHGHTPTFLSVQRRSKIPSGSSRNKALMLCYPPPESSMAVDTLNEFLTNGGSCLIHIGEFKGLTGDAHFEALLLEKMTCYFREPCLTWGTDASHVTIWMKDSVSIDDIEVGKASKLLLPCSHCGIREATRRCRLERNLVYCSEKCFDADTLRVDESFKLRCIPLQGSQLQFKNDKHFTRL